MRDVITRRVERLGRETHEVLTLAAVIGRSFELELLGRLVETRESELLDRLETAVTASLLDESAERVGRFRFVHALINQTLYEGLGATRRSSIHHRVAVALEELYGQERDRRAGVALAAGGDRQAEGGSLLGARRPASARQPRAGGGGQAVRRRARPARAG